MMRVKSQSGSISGAVCMILLFAFAVMAQNVTPPLVLHKGPQLFIDDYLIADQNFISRTVNNPKKLPEPVVTAGKEGDQCFQPYVTVLRDPDSGRFRIWYGTPENAGQSHIGYMESEDGIHWIRPHRILSDPHVIKFGVCVLDRRPYHDDPATRYLYSAYMNDGFIISTSADGLNWHALTDTTLIKLNHDITFLYWDPIRKHYTAIVSQWEWREDWKDHQRTPHESISTDLIHWEKPWPIIRPKMGAPIEQGEMQFYSMSGVVCRGDLLIGLVKVLRDDLNATPGKSGVEMGDLNRKAAGLGYTVLAWSRDGRTWQRDHEPFLDRNPIPGSWDHAFAWGDYQINVDGETWVYYGGYARGHKVARFDERQIGLARMPRDRYVAREADLNPGRIVTRPLLLDGTSMTVNAHIAGFLKMRLLDQKGKPLQGFDWTEIKGDGVDLPVVWKSDLSRLRGKTLQIEFQLKDAQLFGFTLN
jgi:hypothetical protein